MVRKTNNSKHWLRSSVLAVLTAMAFGVGALSAQMQPQAATPRPGMTEQQQKLQQEFQKISSQLKQAQQQAMQTPEVRSALELARSTLEEKMIAQSPDMADTIKRYFTLQKQLRSDAASAKSEEERAAIQQTVEKLQKLSPEIQPAQQKAMQSEAFQEAQQDARSAMQTAMVEANPKTEELMRRQREIMQAVRSNQQRQAPTVPKAKSQN